MTNLTGKFVTFEELSIAQHTALMDRLQYTNDLLGQLLIAFGGTPPTQSTTLADIATLLVAINEDTTSANDKLLTLADIHLDTISLDQKLLLIRDAISAPGEALPPYAHTSIAWSLNRISAATGPIANQNGTFLPFTNITERLQQIANYLLAIMGASPADSTHSMLYLLQQLATNLGITTQGAEGTVIALLQQLDRLAQIDYGGLAPGNPGDATSTTVTVEQDGRNYVIWPATLPGDRVHTSTLPVPPNAEISPPGNGNPGSGTWQYWKIWVQSTAPYWTDGRTSSSVQLRTNTLITLDANYYPLAVSVPAGATVTAYLFPPAASNCTIYNSVFNSEQGRWIIPLDTTVANGFQKAGDAFLYSVQVDTNNEVGNTINFVGTDLQGNFFLIGTIGQLGEPLLCNVHTIRYGVYQRIPSSGGSFTVTICSP